MDSDTLQDSATASPRRWFRFSLRNLLLAFILFSVCLAWFTGRIAIQETRPTRIAVFGDKLVVYEWELPQAVQSCYLRIDGKPVGGRIINSSSDHKIVRLAVVENDDAVVYHLQLSGATTYTTVPAIPGTSVMCKWRGRQVNEQVPAWIFVREDQDAERQTIRKVEFMIE